MGIAEIRRDQLKAWFKDRSIPPTEKSYISQLLGGKAPFGEKAARRLESTHSMGYGYLDGEGATLNTASRDLVDITAVTEIIEQFRLSSDDGRQQILDAARNSDKFVAVRRLTGSGD